MYECMCTGGKCKWRMSAWIWPDNATIFFLLISHLNCITNRVCRLIRYSAFNWIADGTITIKQRCEPMMTVIRYIVMANAFYVKSFWQEFTCFRPVSVSIVSGYFYTKMIPHSSYYSIIIITCAVASLRHQFSRTAVQNLNTITNAYDVAFPLNGCTDLAPVVSKIKLYNTVVHAFVGLSFSRLTLCLVFDLSASIVGRILFCRISGFCGFYFWT